METYLMMLYVTLDQESALKTFFADQGWTFCKPDLSVTTDKLGPAIGNAPQLRKDSEVTPGITGKRKASSSPRKAPKIKLVKIVSNSTDVDKKSETVSERNKKIEEKDSSAKCVIDSTGLFDDETCDDEEITDMIVKMKERKRNTRDVEAVDEIHEAADSDIEDVGDEENDDTDDSIEGLNDEEAEEKLDGTNEDVKSEIKGRNIGKAITKKGSSKKIKDEDSESSEHEEEMSSIQRGRKTVFTCEICGRCYLSKPTLQRHKKKHSCPFYCRSCSMAFYTSEDLSRHNREKHTHQYSCPTCDKNFKRKSSLSVHIESVHIGVQRFPCTWPDCEKSFFRQDVLNDHINTHTGARPYTCQKCFKSYSSKSSLNHHWKACKTDGLACSICGQVLSSRSGLADHIQGMHDKKPLPCVCGQVFTWRNNLLKHKKNCSVFYASKN